MFYCLFDLINHFRIKNGQTEEEMYLFFKKHGVRKSDVMFSKDHSSLDSIPSVVKAAEEYTAMTELEIYISLGYIPQKYREQFFEKVKSIANLLTSKTTASRESVSSIPAYFTTGLGSLYNGDCIQVMQSIADNSVDLVFADPPFNLAKTYDEGIDDNLSTSQYLSWCYDWLSECIRILKPGGSLFVYNIPKWATYYTEYLNKRLTFRSWIALDMKFSLPLSEIGRAHV